MSLEGLDLIGISRSLSQLAERDEDIADAYLERLEVVEVPPGRAGSGISVRREEGFAIRLSRGDETWMATADSLAGEDLHAAVRQVARSWPQAAYPPPRLVAPEWPDLALGMELPRFASALNRALRRRLVAFPFELTLRRHRRWIQVVNPRLQPAAESEEWFSVEVVAAWGRRGLLTPALGKEAVDELAEALASAFEARRAAAPPSGPTTLALSPQATAIFLHEAVAHALEADTLAAAGRVEAAIGLQMTPANLSVLDDPGAAPAGVRRSGDDEGQAVRRRWLLRDGVIEQPLADAYWAARSPALLPGGGRRGGRLDPPSPRSTHLQLLPGEADLSDLMQGEGIWVPQIVRGRLVVESGICRLRAPFGRRFGDDQPVGGFWIEGHLADLLASIEAIGRHPVATGAGWCAKGRQRLPVWATTPALRLAIAEVVP